MATKNIMCFGDSLTYGWVPVEQGVPTTRYDPDVRWTGVLAQGLGEGYAVIEEGLSARTTAADDPTDPRLNGSTYLPSALASHLPLDLVIIMLGTNDTKSFFHRTPADIATGMSLLAGQVLGSAGGVGTVYPAPKLMIMSPPPLADAMGHPWFSVIFDDESVEKSRQLGPLYQALASFMGCEYFEAGSVLTTDGVDGIHFTPENNRALGEALVEKVRQVLA